MKNNRTTTVTKFVKQLSRTRRHKQLIRKVGSVYKFRMVEILKKLNLLIWKIQEEIQ